MTQFWPFGRLGREWARWDFCQQPRPVIGLLSNSASPFKLSQSPLLSLLSVLTRFCSFRVLPVHPCCLLRLPRIIWVLPRNAELLPRLPRSFRVLPRSCRQLPSFLRDAPQLA